ncbi:MAG: hypothetical protein FJ037_04770 [Chloroflexi bacterium]|nr:hypothetical protein [Chloroflexota bacterium]
MHVAGTRHRRRAVIALGAVVFVVLLVTLLATWSEPASKADTGHPSRSSDEQRSARITELQAALDTTGLKLRDVEAAQARPGASAEASAATASGEIARLRDQVKDAKARAQAAQEATDRATRQIRALTECLNGTAVALQFGRTDAWDPADRALAAVAAACADAKALR